MNMLNLHSYRKERKILTEFQKCLHSMPQRRDREEIERLKQQVSYVL